MPRPLGAWARQNGKPVVVLGRDARTSGPMYARAATAGLMSVGVEVIDVGVVPTPTVQLAVEHHHAGAGLILTASHNPIEWNALKFVGPDGIFLDGAAGMRSAPSPNRGRLAPDGRELARIAKIVMLSSGISNRSWRFRVWMSKRSGRSSSSWRSTVFAALVEPRFRQLLERLGCRSLRNQSGDRRQLSPGARATP